MLMINVKFPFFSFQFFLMDNELFNNELLMNPNTAKSYGCVSEHGNSINKIILSKFIDTNIYKINLNRQKDILQSTQKTFKI